LRASSTSAARAELKDLLIEKLKSGSAVYVSLESATGLDVTAVQLLWAAAREAQRVGVEFGSKAKRRRQSDAHSPRLALKSFRYRFYR